jgi:phospholipid/cholesterol/gamma-HCH transport system substrate-binding protein
MDKRDVVFYSSGLKLIVFTIVSVLVTGLLAAIMGNIGFGSGTTYKAVFTSATSLQKGDDVRIAGVSVGEVKAVDHYSSHGDGNDDEALVTFRVQSDVALTTASQAQIRYLNLVGNRYMSLTQGSAQGAQPLPAGGTIPASQTSPALDLTALFNGFKPLFSALQPDQVNDLTMNLVQVLQGEGGTVQSLLQHTASLTGTLGNRDKLIGEVIHNLDTTLSTVDGRRQQLDQLITALRSWMGHLAADRDTIGGSLSSISRLTRSVAGLLYDGRPLLKSDVAALRRLGALLNQPKNKAQIQEIFDRLPESMTDQTRTGTYGSWYNYYICGFAGKISLPAGLDDVPGIKQLEAQLTNLNFHSTAPRCNNNGGQSSPASTVPSVPGGN